MLGLFKKEEHLLQYILWLNEYEGKEEMDLV